MNRNPSFPEAIAVDQLRFQLSLLQLLYPSGSSPQVHELKYLLNTPIRAMQAR